MQSGKAAARGKPNVRDRMRRGAPGGRERGAPHANAKRGGGPAALHLRMGGRHRPPGRPGPRSAIELLQPAPSAAFRRRGPIDLVPWHEQVLDPELREEMLVV